MTTYKPTTSDNHQQPAPGTGYKFAPQPDITLQELSAVLTTLLNGQNTLFMQDLYDQMPDGAKRHFEQQPITLDPHLLLASGR